MTQPVVDQPTPAAPRQRFGRFDDFVRRPGLLWLAFFAYAAVMASLVQLVVLPYILPGLHDGHGLLIEGDWVYHHRVTAEFAKRITEEGWSAWQIRPNGEYALHGIPSAVYALIAPEPWTLIPLHAALHATSTLLLIYILRVFVPWGVAVVAALSFLLFPSSLITYAQITKDAYSICGGFMFLYGWLLVARWPEGQSLRRVFGIAALIAGGATVAWVARPYLVQILIGISAGFATLVVIRMLVLSIRRAVNPIRGVVASATAWLLVAMLIPFNALGATMYLRDSDPGPSEALSPPAAVGVSAEAARQLPQAAGRPARQPGKAAGQAGKTVRPPVKTADQAGTTTRKSGDGTRPGEIGRAPGEASEAAGKANDAAGKPDETKGQPGAAARRPGKVARPSNTTVPPSRPVDPPAPKVSVAPRSPMPWSSPSWIPSAIDNRMYSLAVLRYRWKSNVGRSTLDQDVMPTSPEEIAAYLPRLMAVGFLAPFPAQWFEDGSYASTTMMRRAVGVEMTLTYVAFVGLALSAWRWRARLEFWFVLFFGGLTTLIWAFIVPNIGSLYRARFGFLMVLVALGLAAILSSARIDRIARVRR